MAKQSSRELALERRKALSETGKKSSSTNWAGISRIRTSADARTTRTNTSFAKSSNTKSLNTKKNRNK